MYWVIIVYVWTPCMWLLIYGKLLNWMISGHITGGWTTPMQMAIGFLKRLSDLLRNDRLFQITFSQSRHSHNSRHVTLIILASSSHLGTFKCPSWVWLDSLCGHLERWQMHDMTPAHAPRALFYRQWQAILTKLCDLNSFLARLHSNLTIFLLFHS